MTMMMKMRRTVATVAMATVMVFGLVLIRPLDGASLADVSDKQCKVSHINVQRNFDVRRVCESTVNDVIDRKL